MVNNTFVNNRGSGVFLQIGSASAPLLARNIFFGGGTLTTQPGAALDQNLIAINPQFVDPANYDYRLRPSSAAIDAGAPSGSAAGLPLLAAAEYRHPVAAMPRLLLGSIAVGVHEYSGLIMVDGFEAAREGLVAPSATVGSP